MPTGWTALIRRPACQGSEPSLTFSDGRTIDCDLACRQHDAYRKAIEESLEVAVACLPETPGDPDGVFVDDTAVVLSNLFVRARMPAIARRAETDTVVAAIRLLSQEREDLILTGEDATLDGSDVIYDGRRLYVGIGHYTNAPAAIEMQQLMGTKYSIKQVGLRGTCPYLKAGCARLGESRFLIDPDWFDADLLKGSKVLEVPREERPGVKALYISQQKVLVSTSAPRTADALEGPDWKLDVHRVDISAFEQVGGSVTRMSLLVPFEVMGHTTRARGAH